MPPSPTVSSLLPSAGAARRPARLRRGPLLAMLALLLGLLGALAAYRLLGPQAPRMAGTPLRQGAALLGALLLCVPALFSLVKRGGLTERPPAWFVAHALASTAGAALILFHASGGQLLSTPGLLVLMLLFLVLQGTVARLVMAHRFARQFGTRPLSFHDAGTAAYNARRAALADLIARKRALLTRLDPQASEAVFSPNLRHALRHPWLTWRYARLAGAEARLVGARRAAGAPLSLWRRMHLAVALLFLCGMVLHIVLVTLFAGYVAKGRTIYWWHLATWGGAP